MTHYRQRIIRNSKDNYTHTYVFDYQKKEKNIEKKMKINNHIHTNETNENEFKKNN